MQKALPVSTGTLTARNQVHFIMHVTTYITTKALM